MLKDAADGRIYNQYLRTFNKMLAVRRKITNKLQNAEDVMHWWIYNRLKAIRIHIV